MVRNYSTIDAQPLKQVLRIGRKTPTARRFSIAILTVAALLMISGKITSRQSHLARTAICASASYGWTTLSLR
jgi:hypothetical protein